MKRNEPDHRPLIGAAIIVVLLTGSIGIFFLDALQRKVEKHVQLVAVLPRSFGIGAGAEVWLAGKAVGRVSRVELLPASRDTLARVAAVLVLPQAQRELIRTDTRLRTAQRTPLAPPILALTPGTPRAPPLTEGDTLRLTASQGLRVQPVLDQARALYGALDSLVADAETLGGKAESRQALLTRTAANASAARSELDRFRSTAGNGLLARLSSDPALGARLDTVAANAATIRRLLEQRAARLDSALAPGGGTHERAARLRAVAARLGRLADALAQGDGTLARLRRDSAIFVALDSVRTELDSLVAETKRNPLRFVF